MTGFYLFLEFFKIGLFAVGGGHATIPFLFYLTKNYNWFTSDELIDMIAVSNITPGPVGINMATYTGYKTLGAAGSVISTTAIILAPFIITILVICFLNKFKQSKIIPCIFSTLRPVSCALLSFVLIKLFVQNAINLKAVFLLLILFILYNFVKNRPSFIILLGAILGICFNTF